FHLPNLTLPTTATLSPNMEYFANQGLAGRPSHSPALSSLSARDMDHLRMSTVGFAKNEFMSPTYNPRRPSMSQLSSTPVMLSNFMTAEKGPWNQFVAFPDSGNQGGSTQAAGPVYSDYRNPPTFSVTSDSGYASQSKRYNDDMSSLGDATFDPDIQNMSTQFRTVNFDLSSPREPELPAASSRQNATAGTSARPDLECQGCGEVVKTKSVLRYVKAGFSQGWNWG
ncbi:hypothetical protein IMZ48_11695, partial [Candidatus Bathyarchaeota archaeon]|nr:hypothetical protein [Candidatus Bathyarchaeota archaeon]